MQHIFTRQYSNTQICSIWRESRFGGRTRCIRCGWTRKFWNLGDCRWECTRCNKKFGWVTDTPISGFALSLRDILELLWWFELGLTDHAIAARLEADYHQVHRFYGKLRQCLQLFEDSHIKIRNKHVEFEETYFCKALKNQYYKNCLQLIKAGKVKPIKGNEQPQQSIFSIYQIEKGLVYINPLAEVAEPLLQNIIKEKVAIEKIIISDGETSNTELEQDHDQQQNTVKKSDISCIEGFWGYTKKRLLRYHGVSPSNFFSYLKEIEFRINHRQLTQQQFANHLLFVLVGNHSGRY